MDRHSAARLDALERRVSALESATPDDTAPADNDVAAPTSADTRADINAYAEALGIDTRDEPTKAAALARIEEHTA